MNGWRMFLGLGIVILGIALFLNSTQIIFLFDDKEQKITLFENLNSANTTLNLDFNFSKDYISKIYEISEGEKIYKNYLNIYCEEFKDNSTTENLTSIQLNDNFYIPENKSYETSLVIVESTLNDEIQHLEIKKSSGLTIDKIELEYIGADYRKKEIYDQVVFIASFLIIMFGVLLGLYPI